MSRVSRPTDHQPAACASRNIDPMNITATIALAGVYCSRPARCAVAWRTNLWGSEIRFEVVTCVQSGSDVVLVGESAENLLLVDPVLGEVDRFGPLRIGLGRGELAEGTVRPGSVVMA